ncbi:MAG: membrane dipeptidase [Oscillospiraceae bacterium]|nr:membrane dipeptidase [Oscillospiraceae bacterium]
MRQISVFDAHCDTVSRLLETGESLFQNGGMVELEKTKVHFRDYCQFFALFANSARPDHPTYEAMRDCFWRHMEAQSAHIVQCRTAQEALEANRQGRAAAFLTVEGAELLNCDTARLECAARDGVTAINLTWNHANAISGSCNEERERGLSDLGRRFVARMEDLDILVDVSHLSDAGIWDVLEQARRPIIASHSNARAVCDVTRNLTDEQITAIINNQGLIGLNFYRDFIGGTLDFDAVRRHLDHILDLGGSGSLALGGDWDGCETIDALPGITDLTALYEYLLKCGYAERLVCDIFYNNLMRVVSKR